MVLRAKTFAVRKGFLFGAFLGFSLAGTSIWALSSLPLMRGPLMEPSALPSVGEFPKLRFSVPPEMSWFFIQFPYVSDSAKVKSKNHHTYLVDDPSRQREYVVTFGQQFRRVEIYDSKAKDSTQVQVFTPGFKRTVWMRGDRISGQSLTSDGNLWMWRGPLWNAEHLKIYGMADLWLDSPYKRYSCAGFVHKFLQEAGVNVPILDAWDIAKQPWRRVSMDEMEPGDIITFKALTAEHRRFWGHRVTHVGVYIGHGKFIHAATSSQHARRSWVRIADLQEFRGRVDKILRPPELL